MMVENPAKIWWKAYYRQMRIARREAWKATKDAMIFGTGAVLIPNNGDDPRHIPVSEITQDDLEGKIVKVAIETQNNGSKR